MGKTERGLSVHVALKHPQQRELSWQDKPRREAPPAGEAVAPPAPPPPDLSQVGKDLASNIKATGALLHGLLFMLKVRHVMTGAPPAVDTHLAHAIQLRAEMTAELLIGYAATNPVVLRAVTAFNALFTGGALATVVGAHLIAAGASANLRTPVSEGAEAMFIPDVLAAVEQENQKLEIKIREVQAAAAAAQANGAA